MTLWIKDRNFLKNHATLCQQFWLPIHQTKTTFTFGVLKTHTARHFSQQVKNCRQKVEQTLKALHTNESNIGYAKCNRQGLHHTYHHLTARHVSPLKWCNAEPADATQQKLVHYHQFSTSSSTSWHAVLEVRPWPTEQTIWLRPQE
jgi:hypothetical protein